MATTTEDASPKGPSHVALPAAGPDFLSEAQWMILMGIMDTIAPRIQTKDQKEVATKDSSVDYLSISQYSKATTELRQSASPQEVSFDLINAYLAERPSENPVFTDVLKVILSNLPPSKKRDLRYLLSILNTRPGSLLLSSCSSSIPSLPLASRTNILHSWRTSSLPPLRALFKSLTTLAKLGFVRSSQTFSPLTGFPATPPEWMSTPSHPYQFLQFQSSSVPVEIDTDVVIIGSGCGAGVVTNRLANTFGPSLRVLVLEKGRHLDASHFPLAQSSGLAHLFEADGVIESDDGSVSVTAGSCFGGGGTVNWSASLRPQDFVRNDWAERHRLAFFEDKKFDDCLNHVWDKMGCAEENIVLNHGNKVLLEGAKKCGFKSYKKVPQNCGNEKHDCGYCTLGCWKGEKKGPVNGWFPEAVERGNVQFAEGFKVDRVLFEMNKGWKVASGVEGVWMPKEGGKERIKVRVKAKKVVVSCGSLWSPIVLMNSGLKNPQIGRNLYLHPVNFVAAVYDHDVRPWEGGCLTSVVGDFENLDGKGHGAKLEAMSMMPTFALPFLPWASGRDFKLLAAKYRHMNSYISIIRDRDAGYIYKDPVNGGPRVSYTPSDFDRANNLAGVIALCKILFAEGAREIIACLAGFEPYIRPAVDAEKAESGFKKWLEKLKSHGNKQPVTSFVSAHQMGSCRMSAKAKDGVVDPQGRVWGTEGLYVADASVFPTASGVNPMITTMAIADWVARGLCEDLKKGEEEDKPAARL